MSGQHVVEAPIAPMGRSFAGRPLAALLGVLAVLLLLLAISAPWWLAADMETLGLEEMMAQASPFRAAATNVWLFAVPLAVVLGATAFGVVTRAGASRIAVFLVAAVAALLLPVIVGGMIGEVVAPFFGVGGTLIEIFLLLTFWFWARERRTVSDDRKLALDLRMSGYGLFAAAAWFVCGMLAMPVFGLDPARQMEIGSSGLATSMAYGLMVYLVVGWALVFTSQYMTARQAEAG